ncbi:Pectinesterase 2 [Capsicum annuum]|uniref:Pectinesterase n=1 Tax=Capsicum annuum TaxID=4072 RepID=A0A2G3A459_CAPAN|nr:Pectinesterase 2 [Capsicum annuum]
MKFGKKGKLSPRYVVPYMILRRVGDPSSVVPLEGLGISNSLSYEEILVEILDLRVRFRFLISYVYQCSLVGYCLRYELVVLVVCWTMLGSKVRTRVRVMGTTHMKKAMTLGLLALLTTLFWGLESKISPFDTIVALDGSGDFKSITEALQAAPDNSERRYNIKIKEGIYNEYVFVHKNKTNITFIGEGTDRTIITGSKSNGTGFKTNETATVDISGYGFIAQDITFQNTAGPSMHQAVATSISADHVVFYRCKFDGYQDTLYTKNGVQFFRDCEVYGTVDFIFGNAKVILQNCNIYARRPDDLQNEVTITAQGRKNKHEDTAIVLQGCTINVTQDLREREPKVRVFLGRSWKNHSRTIIMSSFLDEFIDPKGWVEWNGNMEESNKVKEVFYAYITRRINLIEALINDGNSFHKTIYETYGKEWQFDLSTLSDYLLPRLPSSTMLLNFTSDKVSEYSWLSTFIIQCKTWLLSNVVYSKWLGKENRGILFKKIDDMPKIKDIVLKVVKMKDYKYKDNDKDDEHIIQCDLCPDQYTSTMNDNENPESPAEAPISDRGRLGGRE